MLDRVRVGRKEYCQDNRTFDLQCIHQINIKMEIIKNTLDITN